MERKTIQRDLVMRCAGELDHPTADEIYRRIEKNHPTISRGTVYRNLNLLVQRGKLRRVALPDGADRFDITLDAHYHIHCRLCGRIDDIALPYKEDLIDAVADAAGYLVEDHDIILRGVCPGCSAAEHSVPVRKSS